jgi:hypothetical protein
LRPIFLFYSVFARPQKALDLASATAQDEVTKQIRRRLELYKQGKPYTLDPNEPEAQLPPSTEKTGK